MRSMTRLKAILVLMAAVLVACGEASGTPVTTGAESGVAVSTSSTSPAATTDDRPTAPDFTLSLEPSGQFVLSEAGKPVYLVFWAEW